MRFKEFIKESNVESAIDAIVNNKPLLPAESYNVNTVYDWIIRFHMWYVFSVPDAKVAKRMLGETEYPLAALYNFYRKAGPGSVDDIEAIQKDIKEAKPKDGKVFFKLSEFFRYEKMVSEIGVPNVYGCAELDLSESTFTEFPHDLPEFVEKLVLKQTKLKSFRGIHEKFKGLNAVVIGGNDAPQNGYIDLLKIPEFNFLTFALHSMTTDKKIRRVREIINNHSINNDVKDRVKKAMIDLMDEELEEYA